MNSNHHPEFATNRDDRTVADALNGHLGWVSDTWAKPFEVAIASAYFNPGGFGLVAHTLEQVPKVRLLLGAEPDSRRARPRHLDRDTPPQRAQRAQVRNALATHERDIQRDRDLLGFEIQAEQAARRLIEWLRSGRVEVRRFEEGFLHGKAFIVATDDEGVLAGSSNFTYAGLARNLELNLGHYQPSVVRQVREWFEELWEDAVPYDLAAVYDARYQPHNPYLVYLRMLYERYGEEIQEEAAAAGVGVHLTNFQQDGVWRARRILKRHTGVLIADGVGLGKSFLAGELIREAVQDRRQRVLLVAPASLRDGMWKKFLLRHQLGVEVVSYEQLSADQQLSPGSDQSVIQFDAADYAMIVVDESHAYRNPGTERAEVLRRLLAGSPPKDLVLLTATPVNNSLWDLYYLLSYFIKNDAAFAGAGIPSLRDHFSQAMAEDPESLAPDRLFDVLDAVAVRRTRHFVKRYYPSDTIRLDGQQMQISFPKPVVRRVDYETLDSVLPGFLTRFAHALDCDEPDCGESEHSAVLGEPVLTLARYRPSTYRVTGDTEAHEQQLTGLLRSGLLKRFESSAYAFGKTCRKMADSHDAFLDLLDQGQVATGEALAEWIKSDTDEIDEFIESHEALEASSAYDVDVLREAVTADRDLLRSFASEAEKVTRDVDPKLAALRTELVEIVREAEGEAPTETIETNKRKVILLSYYADTADWVREYLEQVTATATDPELAVYGGRVVQVRSGEDKTDALFGFAPISAEATDGHPDKYDILISTDVLAEGVNLQQARHVINIDLPWNPMRMVQRHGRVDRIGSRHDRVYIRCFFPTEELDLLLGLEQRLHRKIRQAAASVGVEGEILPGSEVSDITFTETRDEIERLRSEDSSLFEESGERGNAYSGEEYRQELRQGLQDPDLRESILALPWGSGSGLVREGAQPGFVFCARVGDRTEPIYRYVGIGDGEPEVISDTLTCLAHAHATADTDRVLDEAIHLRAYDAWNEASSDILTQWTFATDPANLQPSVPKTMRDAAQLLRDHPPMGMAQQDVDRLIDTTEAPYPNRIQKLVRDAVRVADDPRDAAEAVARVVREQGLQPAVAPEPLPVISEDDIHLVCWQAIVPPLPPEVSLEAPPFQPDLGGV
ncbi:MAG: helicase [Acidimicrobiia bacterium]|nr:helicase [Acidimicrobiia bacterium]